jgi:16S rRNA G1207 methylase RsmC
LFTHSDIPRLKKDLNIKANLLDFDLSLDTRWGVFSPREIDEGTILLLKYLEIDKKDICLDLGCGYGPIGLAIAKHAVDGQVYLVDKDFVAIELVEQNIKNNQLNNCTTLLSDGLQHLDKDIKFTQIISNVPAKVGREQLSIFLYDALDSMEVGAKITVVTINGLRQFIKNNFKSVFGNYKKLKQGSKYTISQAIKE